MSDYDMSVVCRRCGLKTLAAHGDSPRIIRCATCGWESTDGSKRPSDEEKR